MLKLTKPLVLCGFMASGKSTIGHLAAEVWHLPFHDTDSMITVQTGKTIPEIFDAFGEVGFRDIEHDICQQVSRFKSCVVSTGGGLLTFERNGDVLKEKTCIVLLHRDFDKTWTYLSGCRNRPMIRNKTKEEVQSLYLARIPLYRRYADIEIQNNDQPDACLKKLESALYQAGIIQSD
ncbi:MAG: shikimate kinase [Clostridia bacterium]|nr:shikimate kinase [Clostridia bacterium]